MHNASTFWLSRMLFQRGMGLLYLLAFVGVLNQFLPLLGEQGLLPVRAFVRQVSFLEAPSLFYFFPSNIAFTVGAWVGIFLSGLALTGLADRFSLSLSVTVWGLLWILYLSFVNVGQIFYAFGWESILLEAGFYAIFLGPSSIAPPVLTIWMLRWLLLRVMFGAGLIKLRGDSCWRDLSCLDYHYETQPMPNPLSWYFHWAPEWTHRAGVAFNHWVEVVVPFGYFAPPPISAAAGLFTLIFQGTILASGNLACLNALTMVLTIPTFSDRWLRLLMPAEIPAVLREAPFFQNASIVLGVLVALMSIGPILNMLSARQMMNFNYNPLHLVGTYGAFGSVTRTRYEVVIEGTDEPAVTSSTVWKEYEFKGKPGVTSRRPPQIAPYHLRLDWLMWFAAMGGYAEHPWFVHLMEKLLQGDAKALSLLRTNPFSSKPPRYVRAELFVYHFTSPSERSATGRWWKREWAGDYFPVVSLSTPEFRQALERVGW